MVSKTVSTAGRIHILKKIFTLFANNTGMKTTLLRFGVITVLLCIINSSVSAQTITVTGTTLEALNLDVAGTITGASLTTTGNISTASLTATGNINVLGSLYVGGAFTAPNFVITSLTAISTLSTTSTGNVLIGTGGLSVNGGITTTGTLSASGINVLGTIN